MTRKEYIEKLEDGTKLKFTIHISSSMYDNYQVQIHVTCQKCLPKKRTWILNTDVTTEQIKQYKITYLKELLEYESNR